MVIAIIVVTVVLALAVITHFVVTGLMQRKKRLEKGEPRPTLKEWWQTHRPSKRRLIQVYAALLFNANLKGFISGDIYTGNSKYMCVPGLNCYSCPGAVGACPLGALQNALRESNRRAPFYMLGIFALFCLILARTVCGFFCPAGLVQEWLYKIRTPKLKKSKVTRALSYFKYAILVVLVIAVPLIYGFMEMTLPAFCKYICPSGTLGGAISLLSNPSNEFLFEKLGPAFTWKFCVLIGLGVACVFIYRAFCRFLCPLGAIYGFFNRIALLGVKLDSGKCTDCGLCVTHCKMDIRKVGDHECINCGECISVCPTKAISWKGSQLFIRGTSQPLPQEEIKPLTSLIKQPAVAAQTAGTNSAETAETMTAEVMTAETQNAQSETALCESTPAAVTKVKPKRDRKFWLEFSAWMVALAVLLAALIGFNVSYKKAEPPPDTPPTEVTIGNAIGNLCPDFTLELYQGGGQYNLYENRGKITLINFWYIGCGGCEAEMPFIGQLSLEYDVEIVVIHGLYTMAPQVDDFLVNNGWSEYNIKFAQDINIGNEYQTYKALGGRGYWPTTLILDRDGIVRYNSVNEFKSFEELKNVVDGIMNTDYSE